MGVSDRLRAAIDKARRGIDECRDTLAQHQSGVLSERGDSDSLLSEVVIAACDEGDVEPLAVLLMAGLSPDAALAVTDGYTILMRASFSSLKATRILLAAGAQPNIQDCRGWTALMYAVALDETSGACDILCSAQIVKLLLSFGADPYLRNDRGSIAADVLRLQRSASHHDVELLSRLLQATPAP